MSDAMPPLNDLIELLLYGISVPRTAGRGQDVGGRRPRRISLDNVPNDALDHRRTLEGELPELLSAQLGELRPWVGFGEKREELVRLFLHPLRDVRPKPVIADGPWDRGYDRVENQSIQSGDAQYERTAKHVGKVLSRATGDPMQLRMEKQKTLHASHRRPKHLARGWHAPDCEPME